MQVWVGLFIDWCNARRARAGAKPKALFSFMSAADRERKRMNLGAAVSAAACRDKRERRSFCFSAGRNANLRSGKVRQRTFSLWSRRRFSLFGVLLRHLDGSQPRARKGVNIFCVFCLAWKWKQQKWKAHYSLINGGGSWLFLCGPTQEVLFLNALFMRKLRSLDFFALLAFVFAQPQPAIKRADPPEFGAI